jgi:hypothetical protein
LIDQGLADGSLQEDWMVARAPMKRLAATWAIANVVRYLASEEASYVTGQTIIADGGWTVQAYRTLLYGCRVLRRNEPLRQGFRRGNRYRFPPAARYLP